MIPSALNNQIIEQVRQGQAAPLRALLTFGARPSQTMDKVEMSVDALGLERSEVVRKSLWQWAHHAPINDGVALMDQLIGRELSTLDARERIELLRGYWKQACHGALEAGQAAPLVHTWKSMVQRQSASSELERVFWDASAQIPVLAGQVFLPLWKEGLLAPSLSKAATRETSVDVVLQNFARHALPDALNPVLHESIESWNKAGIPWVAQEWHDLFSVSGSLETMDEMELAATFSRLNKLLPDARSWFAVLRAPAGQEIVEEWQKSLPWLKQHYGSQDWMGQWAANLEQHVLSVTLGAAVDHQPSRSRRRL